MSENVDPELLDDPEEGVGDNIVYDDEAVDYAPFDASQFELPDDYEYSDEDD